MSHTRLHIIYTVEDQLPREETPVLTNYKGGRILERRWEIPSYYDYFQSYWYWDDPINDGQEIAREEITEWMYIPQQWSQE